MSGPLLGMCFPRELPAVLVRDIAERLDVGGADQLWLIEDCFYTAGISLAATALARTEQLSVGLGILPAVARNPAITAMELATLAELAPGRVLAGIGHGVQDWMAQIGASTPSPVTTLTEVLTAVRALLRGETVTVDGRHVHLSDVRLDQPPATVPPVLAGVRGPKSIAAAGACADGLVLAEFTGPSAVRAAREQAAAAGDFHIAVYSPLSIDTDRRTAREPMAELLAELLLDDPPTGLRAAPFFADLLGIAERDGAAGVLAMPDDWWTELTATGTPEDIAAHIEAMGAAGVDSLAFFPAPEAGTALRQVDLVVAEIIAHR